MSDLYIIKNEQVIKLNGTWDENLIEWEESRKDWQLKTEIDDAKVSVSTVFLGIDHSFTIGDQPVLFETMIFGGKYDGWQQRYKTAKEARKGHDEAVKMVNDTPLWEKIIHIPFEKN